MGAIDLLVHVRLDGHEVLTRRVTAGDGFTDGALVLVEYGQLEAHAERVLVHDIVQGVLADPVVAPGVARVHVRLRPASGEFALQRDVRQVVLAHRAHDFRAPDERLAAPVAGGGGHERGNVRPPIPANRDPLERRHRQPDRRGETRFGVEPACPRVLQSLRGARKFQLARQRLRARELARVRLRPAAREQRLSLPDQGLEQRRLIARGGNIQERQAQRRPHTPDRFRQIRFGQRSLHRGVAPGPRAIAGATEQKIE